MTFRRPGVLSNPPAGAFFPMTLPGVLYKLGRLVLLFFLLVVPLAFFFLSPDRLILFPTQEPLTHAGATRATVPFRGGELELWTDR